MIDIGGGKGAYADALRNEGFDVTLAEVNPDCLAAAAVRGIPVLDMRTMDWEHLRNAYDTALLVEVLEHVQDYRPFLAGALACARKRLLMTLPANDEFDKLFPLGLTFNHIAVSDHVNQFTSVEIATLLSELGYTANIRLGSHLFPDPIIALLQNELWNTWRGKLALLSLKVFHSRGWLPKLFPSRMFVEVRLERSGRDGG